MRRGVAVSGYGFVEQYFGSQNQNFRTMLQAVSDVVLRNVDNVLPYSPSRAQMVDLVVSPEFEPMMEGLPTEVGPNMARGRPQSMARKAQIWQRVGRKVWRGRPKYGKRSATKYGEGLPVYGKDQHKYSKGRHLPYLPHLPYLSHSRPPDLYDMAILAAHSPSPPLPAH